MKWRLMAWSLLAALILPSLPARAAEKPGKFVRSSRAKYKAQRFGGYVVIVAYGSFPTSGYQAKLRKLPLRIFPPQFEFVEQKPDGFVAQVITPFAEVARLRADNEIKSVVIHDANGRHKIKVTRPEQSFGLQRR